MNKEYSHSALMNFKIITTSDKVSEIYGGYFSKLWRIMQISLNGF